jgi:hypothetical protein
VARIQFRGAAFLSGLLLAVTLMLSVIPARSFDTAPGLSAGIDHRPRAELVWTLPDDALSDVSRYDDVLGASFGRAIPSKRVTQRSSVKRCPAPIELRHRSPLADLASATRTAEKPSAEPH